MSFSPSVPSTSAFAPPAQMMAIRWDLNKTTGTYDIFNAFTANNNTGNLYVIRSKILITLSTFQGEWDAQPDFGIPFASLNANSDNPDVLAQIIVNQILTVQNVKNVVIQSLTYVPTTRQISGIFNVNTLFGPMTITI